MAKKKAKKKAAKKTVDADVPSKHAVFRDRMTDDDGNVVTLYGRERCLMPGDEMQQLFGDNVKFLRTQKGLSVSGFAKLVGIHRTTVHRLEANPFAHRTNVVLGYQIAKELGVTVEDLCTRNFEEEHVG